MAKTKIGIIGAGSFGIALAWLLNNNGHTVTVWTRRPDQAERLTQAHGNPDKLPGVTLPDSVRFTSDPAEAVAEAAAVILVVPSVSIRETARLLQPHLPEGALVVDCAKGLEEDTLKPLSTVITEELSDRKARVVVLSGPSHAEEVGRGMPTAIVAASEDPDAARAVQTIFMNPVFRVYTSEDMRGVELGGALKNVIALAAGIA
ncbi:MAG: NAD(P)-binding domain-containing protein, partial [Butyrivibrio sp.]|nr:NAD(P)-binding domain-containing protein [Butyrivibrio sp.]